jgi:hypothetical protein
MQGEQHQRTMDGLPPGFRFFPTDEELIAWYLAKKIVDASFTTSAIRDVDLYSFDPWDLPCTSLVTSSVLDIIIKIELGACMPLNFDDELSLTMCYSQARSCRRRPDEETVSRSAATSSARGAASTRLACALAGQRKAGTGNRRGGTRPCTAAPAATSSGRRRRWCSTAAGLLRGRKPDGSCTSTPWGRGAAAPSSEEHR